MLMSPQGVKGVWNVITADKYGFFHSTSIRPAQAEVLWMSQSAKFKLKYKNKQSPSTPTK